MKLAIPLLAILAGCSLGEYNDPARAYWLVQPSATSGGVCVGSGCPGYETPPQIPGAYVCNNLGGGCQELLPPAHLYRDDPEEKPAIERVEVAEGKFISVAVYARKCLDDALTPAYTEYPAPTIGLCGKSAPAYRSHEFAHAAGMEHGPWVNTGVARCTVITKDGYRTKYALGQTWCNANGAEFLDR